jgi:hypothetical protein
VFLLSLFVVYAALALMPRPMARLTMLEPDLLSVDFHLHTRYSHDGRSGWTAERARAWAAGAGFDAAYITDHRTFAGAEEARAGNPPSGSGGTLLLQGLEAVMSGEHVNILSAGNLYRNLTDEALRDVDIPSLALLSSIRGFEPVVIETLPGDLSNVIFATGPGTAGVRGVELIDGAPRGLTQVRRERDRILQISQNFNLARVAGSDNHGYGHAAAGWTVMRIPGWDALSADSLAKTIEHYIRVGGVNSTTVVERRVGGGENTLSVALMPLVIGWRMFTTISLAERVAWLVWIWGLWFVLQWWRRQDGSVKRA